MTHIAPLVAVILTSSLLTWPAARASIFCTWTKVLPTEEAHYSFVRGDPRQTDSGLRLYHSSWSGERALLSCAWSDDAAVIQNYLSACRERTHEFSDHPNENFDVHSMLESEDQCVFVASPEVGGRGERTGRRPVRSVDGLIEAGSPAENHQGQAERSEVRTKRRVKRGLIAPGTQWCGDGNRASSVYDLGVFAKTDSCCREHDYCPYTIPASQSKFGVFNSQGYTMSHCDCDRRFYNCLKRTQCIPSDAVGITFFNMVKMPCFEISEQLQCTQIDWFGWCIQSSWVYHGVVHQPIEY